jgi:UDP-N-acetyl-D-mannosaminuronate dehydrogenase
VEDLKKAHFHIIGATDIDENKVPNLNPLLGASRSVASALKKGILSFMNLLFIPVVRKKIVCQFWKTFQD